MKKICCIVLSLLLAISVIVPNFAFEQLPREEYTIFTPYEYPVKPGSAEWKEFTTHQEMIDACQIPEDILDAMSTQALVETVLSYPMLGDMFAWSDLADGLNMVACDFNGLQALYQRPDALDYLESFPLPVANEDDYLTILFPIYVSTIADALSTCETSLYSGTFNICLYYAIYS